MDEPNLISICVIAFIAVMLLLSFEAIIISLISRMFPARKPDRELMAEVIIHSKLCYGRSSLAAVAGIIPYADQSTSGLLDGLGGGCGVGAADNHAQGWRGGLLLPAGEKETQKEETTRNTA